MPTADVVVCGGGAVGSSVAWHLVRAGFGGRVVVLEPDPTYARAATALSASGIRQQFSTALNVRLSAYGLEVIRGFEALAGIDLGFREQGYLYLAATAAEEAGLREAHGVQRAEGAAIRLMEPGEIAAAFPHLETADLRLAAFGERGEGWFDNMGLLRGFREGAKAGGVEYRRAEAVGLDLGSGAVRAVRLADGEVLGCGVFVNAAGGQGAEVAAMAGIALPVERRKRTVFTFTCAEPPAGRLPLMIDPSGVWCRPEGSQFIAGCAPDPDPAVAADDFEPRHGEFEAVIWPVLAARSRAFEAVRPGRFWAGHYDMMTLDHNAVVGPHPEVANFLFANGFSGHGLQHAAGIGRALAEWIAEGRYVSLDLAPFGWGAGGGGGGLRGAGGDLMDLFAALHATWPAAATERFGRFTLREGAGGGRRVSAATLEGDADDPGPAVAAMAARGARPLFLVRDGQDALDGALAEAGFVVKDPTILYAASVETVAFTAPDVMVIDCAGELAAHAEIWAEGAIGAARRAVMARVEGAKRYLLGRLDERPAGAGFVALAGETAMLHALLVVPRARRRGLARRMTQGAAAWAAAEGAATFALAVEAANAPARALYEGLGMRETARYHYRIAPEGEPESAMLRRRDP